MMTVSFGINTSRFVTASLDPQYGVVVLTLNRHPAGTAMWESNEMRFYRTEGGETVTNLELDILETKLNAMIFAD